MAIIQGLAGEPLAQLWLIARFDIIYIIGKGVSRIFFLTVCRKNPHYLWPAKDLFFLLLLIDKSLQRTCMKLLCRVTLLLLCPSLTSEAEGKFAARGGNESRGYQYCGGKGVGAGESRVSVRLNKPYWYESNFMVLHW